MEHNWIEPIRRECRTCGAHTFGDQCGCCDSDDLAPLQVNALAPLKRNTFALTPAPQPFTSWQP